jgi:alkylated DNA nucleotide flippase Atl1
VVAARETTLQELLGGAKQYQVPLYQRTYSWGKDQLDKLWEDILQLTEDRVNIPDLTHFMGSLVLAQSPMNGPAGVQDWLVIDGQQRLTTLSLLLCALRDHRAQHDAGERERINELYLVNKWHKDRHTKLQPTQADRAAYLACVDGTAQAGGADPVGAAYRSFKARLAALDDQSQIERLEDALMSGLAIVAVAAGQGDNAYRIFESLNNTGLKLTQADLLRNYLFMRLPSRGETVYQSLWLPLQESLTPEQLETLFWLDLVQRDPRVKQTEIHAEQQKRLDRLTSETEIESEIARFNRLGSLFQKILEPAKEPDYEVRRRLERLQAWGSTTSYPVLLYLLELRDQGTASSEEIARAMLYLESFFVRRLIIGRATANLNRILSTLVTEIDKSKPVDQAIRTSLSMGRKYYATDDEVARTIASIPFYLNGRANQRKLVLQWLEESYCNREPVLPDRLTIEHVLPQTLTPYWRSALADGLNPGETVDQVHESLVHTLGNLTLTGYNSKLSNSSFDEKRELLAASGLSMNQEIARQSRWGRSEIFDRAMILARHIADIWPGPIAVDVEPLDPAWDVAVRALAEIPAGAWTSYGDVAALIGSHPVAVGNRLANVPTPNAHRVLTASGQVSDGFHWLDDRTEDPRWVLESEGITFDAKGRADNRQRLYLEDLAQLAGITIGESPESQPEAPGEADYVDLFAHLLTAHQTPATIEGVDIVVEAWIAIGGRIWWGSGSETSCFLVAREGNRRVDNIWPVVLYPTGKCEVVFQYMAARPPFDDMQLRQEFRERLNKIPGVELPIAKLELRPGFPLEVLADEEARTIFIDALTWFYDQANQPYGPPN